MGPTISIVTACYNSTPFLDRIYQSLASQTYRNFEWICIDDCSTDGTVERLVTLASPGHLGMQVYRLPRNTGGPVALAVGTEHARGEITIWLDHDDELFPFALEEVRRNWPAVAGDAALSGLSLRAADPATGLIGRELPAGLRLTASEGLNRFPDISDGTLALKTELMRHFATVEAMENIVLNGAIYFPMTADRPMVVADAPPIRYYHRDNPSSQTRLERISRKTVASYARTFDAADRHFLRRPLLWLRHVATMLRYSRIVHGRWFEALKFIRRPGLRAIAIMAWPLALAAYARKPSAHVVKIDYFRPEEAAALRNLWAGPG